MDCLNHVFYSYVIVGHIYNFDSWRSRYKNLVLIGKNKMRWCKTFPIVNWENFFPLFFFLLHFFHTFLTKIVNMYSLRLFMHTIQNNIILSSSSNTYWKSDIFLVKVKSALCWWNSRPLIPKPLQNIPRNCLNKL